MGSTTASTPKYAIAENERRCLVESTGDVDLTGINPVLIHDRYITDSHLRLRCVTDHTGDKTYKLCKKYPTPDSYTGAIVNIYLSAAEYALFEGMPGHTLTKKRYRLRVDGEDFGLNVFDGNLAGLVLCEAEKPSREEIVALRFPGWATKDVTEDVFFTGGHLARVTRGELEEKLAGL